MEKMTDIRALLAHEVEDLVSAEEQIVDALPAMIDKATNPSLKKALQQHLRVTEQQLKRIEQIHTQLSGEEGERKKGFLDGLFGSDVHECKGTKGIIDEGKKIMAEDMDADVMDAAIIAASQKIEHYEICGYGTAKAYAKQLGLKDIEKMLNQTLNEEYEADDKLTALAVGRLNIEAEKPGEQNAEGRGQSRNSKKSATARSSSNARSAASPAGKTNGRTATSGRKATATKSSAKTSSKAPAKKSAAKKAAPKKATAKKAGRSKSKSR